MNDTTLTVVGNRTAEDVTTVRDNIPTTENKEN